MIASRTRQRLKEEWLLWLFAALAIVSASTTAALFGESSGRVIVSVPREDDVKFKGLCEGREYPVLRIGVTDGTELQVQDVFSVPGEELRAVHRGTLPAHFGARVTQ